MITRNVSTYRPLLTLDIYFINLRHIKVLYFKHDLSECVWYMIAQWGVYPGATMWPVLSIGITKRKSSQPLFECVRHPEVTPTPIYPTLIKGGTHMRSECWTHRAVPPTPRSPHTILSHLRRLFRCLKSPLSPKLTPVPHLWPDCSWRQIATEGSWPLSSTPYRFGLTPSLRLNCS